MHCFKQNKLSPLCEPRSRMKKRDQVIFVFTLSADSLQLCYGPRPLLEPENLDYFVCVPTVRLRWSQLSPPLWSDLSLSEALIYLLSLIRKESECTSGAATALVWKTPWEASGSGNKQVSVNTKTEATLEAWCAPRYSDHSVAITCKLFKNTCQIVIGYNWNYHPKSDTLTTKERENLFLSRQQ